MQTKKLSTDTAFATGALQSVTLQKIKLAAQTFLAGEALERMEMRSWPDEITNGLVFHLRTFVLGERVHEEKKTVTFRYPETWFQFLKLKFPFWFQRHFPVRWKTVERTVTFEQVQCFPKMRTVLPEDEQKYEFSTFHFQEHGDYPFGTGDTD